MKRLLALDKIGIRELEDRDYFYTDLNKSIRYPAVVENIKVWGKETSIGYEPKYTVKIMELIPGFQCSVHSHSQKTETFYLIDGEMIVETINTASGNITVTELTERFDNITITVNTPHRFYCKGEEPVTFIEVSTAEKTDDNHRYAPSGPRE